MINTVSVSIIQTSPVTSLVDILVGSSLGPGVAVLGYTDRFQCGLIFSSLDVDRLAGGGGQFVALVRVELGAIFCYSTALCREVWLGLLKGNLL